MFRLSLLLLGVLFIDTLLTQTYIADNNNQYHNAVNLTFHDKVLNCKIENRGGPLYDWEKCLMFLYINNKLVSHVTGIVITHKYSALLKSTVKCAAKCEPDHGSEIIPMELEINKMVFIGMCVGAVVVFLLLLVAIVCGVRHCRSNYSRLPQQSPGTESDKKDIPLTGSNTSVC